MACAGALRTLKMVNGRHVLLKLILTVDATKIDEAVCIGTRCVKPTCSPETATLLLTLRRPNCTPRCCSLHADRYGMTNGVKERGERAGHRGETRLAIGRQVKLTSTHF